MSERTKWFREAKFGVFLHYLAATHYQMMKGKEMPDAATWQKRVSAVDVEALADQIKKSGAGYAIITLGQNCPHHCSPNALYDSLVNYEVSYLSDRDLIADLADAMEARGLRLMVYYHGHMSLKDEQMVHAMKAEPFLQAHERWMHFALKCEDPSQDPVVASAAEKLDTFRELHLKIIREWAERWGNKVHGWWIDGCFPELKVWDLPGRLGYKGFAETLRAGNPDSIVAFNPALVRRLRPRTPYEDYIAGEVCEALPIDSDLFGLNELTEGKQPHVTSFLGEHWRVGQQRLSDQLAASYTRHLADHGVVMTWDVPIDDAGVIEPSFIGTLQKIRKALDE
jgi:hypothetical protein